MSTLSRDQILGLLDQLAAAAERRGVRIDMFLVGGAAMALGYSTTRSTKDLDAIFEPKQVVYELAAEVAREADIDLPDDWINDAVKAVPFPGDDTNATVFYETPNVTVRVASPKYLFAMKAWAGRETDEDDLVTLWPLCGFENAEAAIDYMEAVYPRQTLTPKVQYVIEGVAEIATAADPLD